jgi:glycogen(starch) synthase
MILRVVLYTHDWAPQVGGIQTVCTAIANGVSLWSKAHDGQRIELTLVTQTPANGMDDSKLTFRVVRQPSLGELIHTVCGADILHVAGPALLPLLIGLLIRKPLLLEHHGYQTICPNGLLLYGPDQSVCPGHFMARRYGKCIRCNSREYGRAGSFRRLILTFFRRWLAQRAAVNVVPSRHLMRRVALPHPRVVYHGVPVLMTAPNPDSVKPLTRQACFAYVGRLAIEKGLPVLLRAAAELSHLGRDFQLKILGDGPERLNLEKMAQELDIAARTQFTGSVPIEKIHSVLADVTTVVMPSVCEDVAPLVAIEQMMQGRLVIGSDIGGLGETTNGFGLKFPPGDAKALAACMRRILDEPELAEQMGKKAQQHAIRTFSEQRMIEDHMRLYQELLRGGPAPEEE